MGLRQIEPNNDEPPNRNLTKWMTHIGSLAALEVFALVAYTAWHNLKPMPCLVVLGLLALLCLLRSYGHRRY